MAYPVVCNPCLDNDHAHCMEKDPVHQAEREERLRNHVIGGAFCICRVCRPGVNADWFNDVKTASEEARRR